MYCGNSLQKKLFRGDKIKWNKNARKKLPRNIQSNIDQREKSTLFTIQGFVIKRKSYLHTFSRTHATNNISKLHQGFQLSGIRRESSERDVYCTSWKRQANMNLYPNLLFMSASCGTSFKALQLNELENRIHINCVGVLICNLCAYAKWTRQSDQHVHGN